jgi:hypothetical protein
MVRPEVGTSLFVQEALCNTVCLLSGVVSGLNSAKLCGLMKVLQGSLTQRAAIGLPHSTKGCSFSMQCTDTTQTGTAKKGGPCLHRQCSSLYVCWHVLDRAAHL